MVIDTKIAARPVQTILYSLSSAQHYYFVQTRRFIWKLIRVANFDGNCQLDLTNMSKVYGITFLRSVSLALQILYEISVQIRKSSSNSTA